MESMDREYTRLDALSPPSGGIGGFGQRGVVNDISTVVLDYSKPDERLRYGAPGPHDHDLKCNNVGCDEVLMVGWTFEAAMDYFKEDALTLALCVCGVCNILPISVVLKD